MSIDYDNCYPGMQVVDEACYRFTDKSIQESERFLFSNWWREQINQYGVKVKYFVNTFNTLSANNLELVYMPESQVRGRVFATVGVLKGASLKKNIISKKSIKHRDICYICKGDKVTLSANKNGLVIKASGISLTDGNIGDNIKVKNSRTQRIVIGTVHDVNEVYITF